MKFGPDRLADLLAALDRQLELLGSPPVVVAVCGGSALAALGLVLRTTRDVDVLGLVRKTGRGVVVGPLARLPAGLAEAAGRVARDFGLPEDWLNLGPAPQVEKGLPDGFGSRLTPRRYGKRLTVYYASRFDQIHLKLYAAVDQGGYHVQDLALLKPTTDELLAAARWTLSQDVSDAFRMSLVDFLRANGYEEVAKAL